MSLVTPNNGPLFCPFTHFCILPCASVAGGVSGGLENTKIQQCQAQAVVPLYLVPGTFIRVRQKGTLGTTERLRLLYEDARVQLVGGKIV